MSVLNQLFSRGLLGARCKTCLNLVISRIKLLQNRRDVQLKQMRREIAQFLQTGQEAIARIRVEHVIREQNVWAAYEILEMFCEFILVRIPILESQRECPTELREAIASILFAAPHCSDLPDLLQVKKLFTAKYGREFVSAVSELRPDTSVNRTIIEKLTVSAPSPQTKLKLLKEIAHEYNLAWDSSETEVEFSKKHDDLLDGSRKIRGGPLPSEAPKRQQPLDSPHRNGSPNTHSLQSSNPTTQKSINPDGVMESSSGKNSNEGSSDDHRTITSSQSSSDVLEKARAAISAAERASAAARAAALLADSKFGFFKLEGKS